MKALKDMSLSHIKNDFSFLKSNARRIDYCREVLSRGYKLNRPMQDFYHSHKNIEGTTERLRRIKISLGEWDEKSW